MSQEFDDLTAEVTNDTDVKSSAITLLNNLSALLLANPTAAQVKALGTQLKTSSDALAQSIVANTPAAPTA